MPSDAAGPRGLANYVSSLIATLAVDHPVAAARMRRVTGSQRAVVGLDDETVEVWFDAGGELRVDTQLSGTADGIGHTDRGTVLDLLAGRLEASRAVLDGRIRISGSPDSVAAVLLSIEILIDAAARSPAMQALSGEFVAHARRRGVVGGSADLPATAWYPSARTQAETDLLADLGLTTNTTPRPN